MHAFGPRVANEALLEYLEHGTAYEKAGAFRALYWSEILLDERTTWPTASFPAEWEKHIDLADVWTRKQALRLRLIEEFVSNEDPVARRSLATEVCFDAAVYPESLRPLVKRAIEIARSHPDPFVQDWVAAQLEPRHVTVQLPDGPTQARVLTSRGEATMPPVSGGTLRGWRGWFRQRSLTTAGCRLDGTTVPFAYRCLTPVNVVFSDVPRGHDLHVTSVGIDEHAIRVEYRITPALARPGGRPAIHWAWRGSDDAGNVYEDYGGGFGQSADGQATDGVLSLRPIPAAGVHTLDVVLDPWMRAPGDQPSVRFQVVLSVPADG